MSSLPCHKDNKNVIAVLEVPTKSEDNCSLASMLQQNDVLGQKPDPSKFDAFRYYSDDLRRLKTLLLGHSNREDEDLATSRAAVNQALRSAGLSLSDLPPTQANITSASKRRRGNNSQCMTQQEFASQRKTRLSWELHPSLLLHDLYDEDEVEREMRSELVSNKGQGQ